MVPLYTEMSSFLEESSTVITLASSFLQPTYTETAISYPNMDENSPPSYEASSTNEPGGVGQLIDLGTDITNPPNSSQAQGDDIVTQLAQLGVTTASNAAPPAETRNKPDEFDIFAKSRTAYGTQHGYV